MNLNKTISTLSGIVIIVAVSIILMGGILVFGYFAELKQQSSGVNNVLEYKVSVKNDEQNLSFEPLENKVLPLFIKNIKDTTNIKVVFHYDGDYEPQNDWGWAPSQFYTNPETNEKMLLVSKAKDRQNFDYGANNYLSLFKSEGSHSYQGTPIFVANTQDKYSLSYLGFKISDKSLLSELKVSLGIDYNAETWDNITTKNDNSFSLASLLGIQTASACGPGLYLRRIGDEVLNFVEESNGVAWYKLQKPIALYDLRLQYSDQDCYLMPNYCKDQFGDPKECDKYFSCYYNATIKDLSKGNLRMHVNYKANDKEGILKIQMANFIVSDQNGAYYQAEMGEYFNHYYKAYLQ
jgi:hypothetical protein